MLTKLDIVLNLTILDLKLSMTYFIYVYFIVQKITKQKK